MASAADAFKGPYQPHEHEDAIYRQWEESGLFNPDTCIETGVTDADAEPFSIVLPPPNVTGTLHMGHAAMLALEDTVVRFQRMRGKRTLWIPGTDHAAIATASKVEAQLYETEGKTRYDLGREEFLRRVADFAQNSHDTIIDQLKKMGSSLDWSREAYTLDGARSHAVRTAFKRMYDDGLIYRGAYIVNWDPNMETTVSDDEIEYKESTDAFYYFQYGPFTIGTARPETKFGDKYVVMHPDDERYQQYAHGQQIEVEWINGPTTATIIKDEAADPEFGTGVMTITPWHDATDFDIAERHDLEKEQIIDWDGTLLSIAGEFAGMPIAEARPKIVAKMQEKGLLLDTDTNYTHNVSTNSRGGGVIEPQVKEQWFVAVDKPFTLAASNIDGIPSGSEVTLKQLMRHVVETRQISIIPDNFEKIYFNWTDNLRDWCISRQIWYGHRIPVWYRETSSGETETYCGVTPPEGDDWEQDPDTLDTWFSSGLWTFSTLGWPATADTATAGALGPEHDLANYHPTSLLETGYDILFFWVARMILMTTYHRGEIPFPTVYLHGMVRDGDGQKMSKSKGNVKDPLDVIPEYGADATRMSLIAGSPAGSEINLGDDKLKAYKHFANKVWNASRFTLMQLAPDFAYAQTPELSGRDAEIVAMLNDHVAAVTDDIESYRLHLAAEKLYDFFWHTFADVIIEESKPIVNGDDTQASATRQWVLYHVLTTQLKLLHPFMPFVTELVWQRLPERPGNDLLLGTPWPNAS